MVWIYEDPPFTKREVLAYKDLRKKLKDKKFVDELIKLISLYIYIKKKNPSSVKEIRDLAFFDRKREHPIFDEKTAKRLLSALKQKGGTTSYPYTDFALKSALGSITPEFISGPLNYATGTVRKIKESIPFADLAVGAFHGVTEFGVLAANDVGQAAAGPVGAAVVAPFTAVAAGAASVIAIAEGDLGGAVAHVANWVPEIGIILNKLMRQTEEGAEALEKHPSLAAWVPFMAKYHESLKPPTEEPVEPVKAGKRLSTMRHKHNKWPKTIRHKRSVIH